MTKDRNDQGPMYAVDTIYSQVTKHILLSVHQIVPVKFTQHTL